MDRDLAAAAACPVEGAIIGAVTAGELAPRARRRIVDIESICPEHIEREKESYPRYSRRIVVLTNLSIISQAVQVAVVAIVAGMHYRILKLMRRTR
jgi:hypothetical protein